MHPPLEIKSNFKFKTLKRHLLKQHLTLSEGEMFCHSPSAKSQVAQFQIGRTKRWNCHRKFVRVLLGTAPPRPHPRIRLPPVLLFLGLFENTKENLKNTKDFSHPANPKKPWKISRKHPKRPRNSAARKNTKETKTSRKRRTGPLPSSGVDLASI